MILILAGVLTVGRQTPIYQRLTSRKPWVSYDVGGKILVPSSFKELLVCLQQFVSEKVAPNENILIAPFTQAYYAIVGRESPLWDLVFYFPATTQRQKSMIRQLEAKNVNWAIISDVLPDKRADLHFSVTHKSVWQYLMENFDPVKRDCLPKSVKIFRRKAGIAESN